MVVKRYARAGHPCPPELRTREPRTWDDSTLYRFAAVQADRYPGGIADLCYTVLAVGHRRVPSFVSIDRHPCRSANDLRSDVCGRVFRPPRRYSAILADNA